jgi:hypothetical protein
MRNENNINNSKPPLFVLNIWAKGIIKNNVNVKLKKKLQKDKKEEEKEEKKDEDDDLKKYIYKFLSFVKSFLYNHTQLDKKP